MCPWIGSLNTFIGDLRFEKNVRATILFRGDFGIEGRENDSKGLKYRERILYVHVETILSHFAKLQRYVVQVLFMHNLKILD